jgi:SP family general alpha glucoside:H+ symporter-like MFS transporter
MSAQDAPDHDLKDIQKAENFLTDAQAGNEAEQRMSLWQALKLYPKASAWSILISFAVVMEGKTLGVTRC